jgi:hypothetical protein
MRREGRSVQDPQTGDAPASHGRRHSVVPSSAGSGVDVRSYCAIGERCASLIYVGHVLSRQELESAIGRCALTLIPRRRMKQGVAPLVGCVSERHGNHDGNAEQQLFANG